MNLNSIYGTLCFQRWPGIAGDPKVTFDNPDVSIHKAFLTHSPRMQWAMDLTLSAHGGNHPPLPVLFSIIAST